MRVCDCFALVLVFEGDFVVVLFVLINRAFASLINYDFVTASATSR